MKNFILFLDRRNPKCIHYVNKESEVSDSHKKFKNEFSEIHKECRKLTANFKSKLAYEVIQYVRRGFNTFGKLKKVCDVLPNFGTVSERELKSAIRYAKVNRIPMPKVIGRGRKRQTIVTYRILSIKGRTYEVVDV